MLREATNIFVVGTGGIGISALAKILKAQGKGVSGSDLEASEITQSLERAGIRVAIGHREENLPGGVDLLIYSSAVGEGNPERARAARLNVAQLSYPEALGELAQEYGKVIAVAGTNGKTTTTAMIGWVLEQAGLDPTVVVGSKVLAWDSNARIGKKNFLVVEADEYRRAFLNYASDVAVITNIAADHLDYFRDLEGVKKAFREFAGKLKPGGKLIDNYEIKDFSLKVPGKFNQANASAAAQACEALGIPGESIRAALESFIGTWRRFELVGRVGRTEIRSDYAHHPAGVKVTLDMVQEEYQGKRVLAVFQPHQHNRTKKLFAEFVEAFCASKLQDFIIAEIFDVAGREETQDQDISSQDLVREILKCQKKVQYAKDIAECEQMVREVMHDYDLILIMGAGDIYKVADNLVRVV